ncbi:MAG: SDR family oxidoreductase [Bacteroidia bacterium]|nr:SDR family oxidoreductase [Bacteroidia bacterium]
MNQKPVVFISGASRGIGLAIAKIFYQNHYQVIICGRNLLKLTEAETVMPGIDAYQCDIAVKEEVKALAEKINQKYGALDILINNGGTFQPGQIHSEADEVFESLMKTNLSSAYYFTKTLLPPMIQKKSGTVVNICSIASITPYANGGSYSISKFAMLGFGKVLREEMKPHGIRVVNILPGAVLTDSWAGTDLPESRFIAPEDISSIVWNSCTVSNRTVVEDIIIRPLEGDI